MQTEQTDRTELPELPQRLGLALRWAIKKHKEDTGCTYRHLSLAVGRDRNFIAGSLSQPIENWAIPKHPAYGMLMGKLGLTDDQMLEAYEAAKAQGQAG